MRLLADEAVELHSAGSQPAGYVHPLAIAAMAEIGVDISEQQSKGLDEFSERRFDYVVTVCDHARGACPHLAGVKATLHWSLPDPAMVFDEEDGIRLARKVREELRERIGVLIREQGLAARSP